VRSVSLRGKRRFSNIDVERARLLHQYALHRRVVRAAVSAFELVSAVTNASICDIRREWSLK
jgi:hypothetical protein